MASHWVVMPFTKFPMKVSLVLLLIGLAAWFILPVTEPWDSRNPLELFDPDKISKGIVDSDRWGVALLIFLVLVWQPISWLVFMILFLIFNLVAKIGGSGGSYGGGGGCGGGCGGCGGGG